MPRVRTRGSRQPSRIHQRQMAALPGTAGETPVRPRHAVVGKVNTGARCVIGREPRRSARVRGIG